MSTPGICIPNIVRIGHCVLYVTDLAESKRFYVDRVGLNVLHETPAALYLRGVEDREWSLKLELAREPGVKHLGYKVASNADVEALAALAREHSLPHRWQVTHIDHCS